MKIIDIKTMSDDRKVEFHSGVSNRILLDEDKMGYTMTKTVIESGKKSISALQKPPRVMLLRKRSCNTHQLNNG